MAVVDLTADSFYELNERLNVWMKMFSVSTGISFLSFKYFPVLPAYLDAIMGDFWLGSSGTRLFLLGAPALLILDLLALAIVMYCRKRNIGKKGMSIYMLYLTLTMPFFQSLMFFHFVVNENMPFAFVIAGVVVLLLGIVLYFIIIGIIRKRLLSGRYKRDYKDPKYSKKRTKAVIITIYILALPMSALGGNAASRRAIRRFSDLTLALIILYLLLWFIVPFMWVAAQFTWQIYFVFNKRFHTEKEAVDNTTN